MKMHGALFPFQILPKIAYEITGGFGFPNPRSVAEVFVNTFNIYKRNGETSHIAINLDFYKRVSCDHPQILNGEIDLSKVKYRPFHRMDLRVANESGVAYLRISFFEAISFIISIGRTKGEEYKNLSQINQTLIFPTDEYGIIVQDLPAEYEELRKKEDKLATEQLQAFESLIK